MSLNQAHWAKKGLHVTRRNEDRSQPPVPWGTWPAWYLQCLPIPWPTNIITISYVSFSIASPVLATKHTGFSFAMKEDSANSNVIWIWIGRHWLKHTTEELRICSEILFLLNILLLQFMIMTFRRAPLNCRRFRHFEEIQVNSSFK